MPEARRPGDEIRGAKIGYTAGSVHQGRGGSRVEVSLGLDVDAWVIAPLFRGDGVPGAGLTKLVARTAAGICDRHDPRKAKVHVGAHRRFEGVMKGDARLAVKLPKGPKVG
jgi:hypothetical protein